MTTSMKTHDLGHGWWLNQNEDGSATVRSPDRGMRVDLPAESVALLRKICADPGFDPKVATGFDKPLEQALQRGDRVGAAIIRAERRMARALVDTALDRGYLISVNDGEEWVVKRSTDKAKILAALFSSDEDWIHLRGAGGEKAGWFRLIYGNSGWDTISDFTENPVCAGIWNEVLSPLADKLEAGEVA